MIIAANSHNTILCLLKFIPSNKHTIGKDETHFIESFNCNVRHYLARFRRKTRCYSKCKKMVEYSLYLLFWKDIALSMF
jgi:insertion element IS1 protein InsB